MVRSLVFIDTNVLLDLYRSRGSKDGPSVLRHIDEHHDRIITGEQVEMEFKKNRQRVIMEALSQHGVPSGASLQVPSFLREAKAADMVKKAMGELKKQSTRIRKRLGRILENPTAHDPVYKSLQRLWRSDFDWHMTRTKDVRHRIRRFARKRFALGYPPRKRGDTSYGDSVNWEWVVHCAIESKANIVIVSRDSDYGLDTGSEALLNDWLRHEFAERVSRRRKILLTSRLTEGFKEAAIRVTQEDQREEEQILASRMAAGTSELQAAVGSTVVHQFFGDGVLRELAGKGDDERVRVDFASSGEKWLSVKYANLQFK